MCRRLFLISLGLYPLIAASQPLVGAVVLLEVAKALGEAGDAISKITKGFRDLVIAGHEGYSYIAAKRDRDRLVDLSAKLTQLGNQKQILVVQGIEDYIRRIEAQGLHSPPPKLESRKIDIAFGVFPSVRDVWREITENIVLALTGVKDLLDNIKKERSDFVLEKSYRELIQLLSGRAQLLTRLKALEPPITKEDLAALKDVNTSYKLLLNAQYEAIKEMNAYIRRLKK